MLSLFVLFRQKVIEELTGKCRSQEGKMEQLKGFEAERRKYEVRPVKVGPGTSLHCEVTSRPG